MYLTYNMLLERKKEYLAVRNELLIKLSRERYKVKKFHTKNYQYLIESIFWFN
jgi:hypothetical protein